tara:strand:+ start:5544 stop:6260 length:717 start_codon:yes stop_codon:yes gene_type:complete
MKKLLLIQPGAFGDIIVCAPIARFWANAGYKVYYPARKKFHSLINSLDYVTPITLDEEELHPDWLRSDVMKILPTVNDYDLVLNLADRGPHPTAQKPFEKGAVCKYRLAKVPLEEQYNLVWSRNKEKEDYIYDTYVNCSEYAFVHATSSDNEEITLPNISLPIVKNEAPSGYNIFDWYKVLCNAKEIYCSESALHCFCDGISNDITSQRYLLPRQAGQGQLLTLSKFWDKRFLNNNIN